MNMNPCPEYETRILDSQDLPPEEREIVNAHIAGCGECQQFSMAVAEVDYSLSAALNAFAEADPSVTVRVLHQASSPPVHPPLWPELLDLLGWASLMGLLMGVTLLLAPNDVQDSATWLALGAAIAIGSVWFGVKSWRELGSE